jgi:hypothetical protein
MLKKIQSYENVSNISNVQFHSHEKIFNTISNTSQEDESIEDFYIIYDGGYISERGGGLTNG